jgi:4-carboxymuconolactone decarboxylase
MKRDAIFKKGLEQRRSMFGEVTDAQLAGATTVDEALQEFVTRQCFGETWQREGLDTRLRSLVTITICVSTGRSHEARVHMIGGLKNGLTVTEIREAILHGIMYTGLPPAVEGIRILRTLVEEGFGDEPGVA